MRHQKRLLMLGIWVTVLLLCVEVILHTRFIADLSVFLPKAPTERQQLLVEQLSDGIITRLIMLGIEGSNSVERARLSLALADQLSKHPLFAGVQNGAVTTQEHDRAYFFENRYLLSPTVTAERFSVEGLHRAISEMIDLLAGDASLLVKHILARDPSGESIQLLKQFANMSQPQSSDGVWVSRDGQRAVLLVRLRESGLNTELQAHALDVIRQVFNEIPARALDSRLVMSGASVFAVSSRDTIETEVARLATASFLLVVSLLFLVYRSFKLLVLGLLPVVSGTLVGITAVSLGFGYVHGLTLGFGTTLIGEAVDYSIYLFIQRVDGKNPANFWRVIRLGVFTSVTGFAALLCSSFPGLAQLGLYSISGLITASLVTRYILPILIPQSIVLPELVLVKKILINFIRFIKQLRWFILIFLFVIISSIIFLHTGPIWNRQLLALSPIPEKEQQLDQELRNDLNTPDMRYLVTFTALDEQTALQTAERLGIVLQRLIKEKMLDNYLSPAFVFPSQTLQRIRQAALPDAQEAPVRLKKALVGLPIQLNRLEEFLTDIQAARLRSIITRANLKGTSAETLVDSLLVQRAQNYLVLIPLQALASDLNQEGLIDVNKITNKLASFGLSNIMVIDLLEETTNVFDNYLHEALLLSSLGCLAILGLLLVTLRSLKRALRVIIPLALSVLCVVAILLASGTQLTILHLMGLLLIVAVGSNYALFFNASSGCIANQDQIQFSLVVASLTTISSFGLLGFSKVPVLSAIGVTVGPGAFFALIFSAMLAPVLAHED